MADQTFENNNGRPHHDSGEIGDWLNTLPDREYWAAHGLWYQKPESQHMTFEEYVHESDVQRREQARYDDANAARQGGTNPTAPPQFEVQSTRPESPESVLSDDSLYRSPSPRRGDRAEPPDNHVRNPGRFEENDDIRPTATATVHAVTPGGVETDALDDEAFARLLANPPPGLLHEATAQHLSQPHQGDALDDEALARLLANPPPEMVEQARRAAVPGALDDEALERLLEKQREDIYEGQWRDLIRDVPSADHLSDEDLERFLAHERDKLFSGETEAFPALQHHPDAVSDEDLAKVIAGLGFQHRPLVQAEREESSRSRPTISQTRSQSSGYGASFSSQHALEPSRPTPPTSRMPPLLPPYSNTVAGPSQAFETPLGPVSPNGSRQSSDDQLAERRRRMGAKERRRDEAQELEKIREELQAEAAVREGKQPERYYE